MLLNRIIGTGWRGAARGLFAERHAQPTDGAGRQGIEQSRNVGANKDIHLNSPREQQQHSNPNEHLLAETKQSEAHRLGLLF